VYRRQYRVFRELYPRTKDLMRELDEAEVTGGSHQR